MDFPALTVSENPAAHVCTVALALNPQGRYGIVFQETSQMIELAYRYLAFGGHDSIVNLFDLSDWICSRTISSCE